VTEREVFGTDDTDFTDGSGSRENQSALIFPALDPPAAEGGVRRISRAGFFKQKSRRPCDSGNKARVRNKVFGTDDTDCTDGLVWQQNQSALILLGSYPPSAEGGSPG
jgi:hypothetical protein